MNKIFIEEKLQKFGLTLDDIKPISEKGFSGYFVSKYGDIYSIKSGSIIKLKPWKDNVGYYQVVMYDDNSKRKYRRIHRYVAIYFCKGRLPGYMVNHIDGNKLNNNYENLEWTNNSINTQQGYDQGKYLDRHNCELRVTSKITGELFIFKSIRECAEILSLNRKTISAILKGEKINNYNYDFELYKECNDYRNQ